MAVGGQRLTFTVHNDELNTIIDVLHDKSDSSTIQDTHYIVKASKWRALSPTFLSTNSPFVNADNEIYTGPNNYLTTLVFRVWCGVGQDIIYTDESKTSVSTHQDWTIMSYSDYFKLFYDIDNSPREYYAYYNPSIIKNSGNKINIFDIGDLPTGSIPEGMTPDNFIGGYFDNIGDIATWSKLDENLTYIANKCNVINCSTILRLVDDSFIKDSYDNQPMLFQNIYNTSSIPDQISTPEPPPIMPFNNIFYTPVINQIAEVDRPTMVQSYRGLYQRIVLSFRNRSELYNEAHPTIEFCPIVAKYDSSQIGGDTSGQQDNNTI